MTEMYSTGVGLNLIGSLIFWMLIILAVIHFRETKDCNRIRAYNSFRVVGFIIGIIANIVIYILNDFRLYLFVGAGLAVLYSVILYIMKNNIKRARRVSYKRI